MEQDSTISDLRREVAGLRFGLFLMMLGVVGLFALANLYAIACLPRYEKIFEDMLGSRDKLPELTKFFLGYGRAGGGLLPYALLFSGCAVTFAIMNWMRKSWRFMLVGIVAIILLIIHATLLGFSLNMPLIQIIQGINEKSA